MRSEPAASLPTSSGDNPAATAAAAPPEKHLIMLKRQGLIETWHDRRIPAGDNFAHAIDQHLESADVILLLVSPDFLASAYCYDIELRSGRGIRAHGDVLRELAGRAESP